MMNPADDDRPSDPSEHFHVDTEEVAAIERLRDSQATDSPAAEGLASRLRGLWDRIHAAPHLARLVRINAELRNRPSQRPPTTLHLIHGDDLSNGLAEAEGPPEPIEPRGIDPP